MELSIGSKIYLKRDFIKQFEPNSKTSRSFQIIALTDVAVGLKNSRTGKTYTLSVSSVALNIDPIPVVNMPMPKSKVILNVSNSPTQLDNNNNTNPLPDDNTTPDIFTHIAPMPTGGLKIKRLTIVGHVESGDNPFNNLYD